MDGSRCVQRRRIGVGMATVSCLAAAVAASGVQASADGPFLATADGGSASLGDVTTVTTTCTNGMVIVLLSPFATVPCGDDRAGRP